MNVHAAVQVSGCGECLALSLLQEGSRDTTCVWYEEVEDLLSLVVELKEEVERLRSIWDCGKGIDWWSYTLPSLQEGCGGDALQAVGDHLLSYSQVGRGRPQMQQGMETSPCLGQQVDCPSACPTFQGALT